MSGTPATPEFRAFYETIVVPMVMKRIRKIIGNGEEHIPIIILFGTGRIMAVVPILTEDKDEVASLHYLLGNEPRCQAAVLIIGAWMVTATIAEAEKMPVTGLRDVPGAREVIVVNARHGEQQLIGHAAITRPTEGGPRGSTVADLTIIDANHPDVVTAGRFVEAPDEKETRH